MKSIEAGSRDQSWRHRRKNWVRSFEHGLSKILGMNWWEAANLGRSSCKEGKCIRRSRFAKCSGPACTAVVAVLVLPRVMVHAMQHGSPAQPALSIQVDASRAVRSARRRTLEVETLPVRFFSVAQYRNLVRR